MKQIRFTSLAIIGCLALLTSCSKRGNDVIYTSVPKVQKAQAISDAVPLCGSYKGHMASGKTYSVGAGCNIVINEGDTLFMDQGVTLNMSPASSIVVKGTFISLGTSDFPNWITVNGLVKTDDPNIPAGADSAYKSTRLWCGINCDVTCGLLVLKWTHIEYTSASFVGTPPLTTVSGVSHAILFQNVDGMFIMEDSWMYGSADEVRITCGKVCIMRNTLEKMGLTGGDGFNAKHGTVGDIAYNLFVGVATNGTKASDKGTYAGPETNLNFYNNTYVNGGYRRNSSGRGGSIDYEEGASGKAYNNLIVNCKYGFRVVQAPAADTNHLFYGNTFSYGDSLNIVNQIYPTSKGLYCTTPKSTDIPLPSTFLTSSYDTLGEVYDGSSLIGLNNPMFVNYPLPATQGVMNISYVKGFNFHLKSGSPALGKGYTGFSPLAVVPVDPVYGATEITPPGTDIGCYQMNGTGNQH